MNIECFGCSGGMAEGFRRAGILFEFVFDKDPDACASYEANLGHRPVQMDVRDLVRMTRGGWKPGGGVDLVVADPPCTPWSRAGKRKGRADERDMLDETVELIEQLRPRAYLIGNVPGLDDSTQWHNVQDALARLAKVGYCIADYAQLDAADYGVPQHRIRPFWFGHLDGPCIRWPAPTHGEPTRNLALPGCDLRPWVTCREALLVLPREEWGKPWRMRQRACNGKQHASVETAPARVVGTSNLSDGNVLLVHNNKHPRSAPDAPSMTISTGGARHQGNTLEWPWERPATTVFAEGRILPPGHHPETGATMSQPGVVLLSESAAALLQGFPLGWTFAGATKRARWSQLGQAMPPGLAEAVARSVVSQMAAARERAA